MTIVRPQRIGPAAVSSPLLRQWPENESSTPFVSDDCLIPLSLEDCAAGLDTRLFETAGARRSIYYDPSETTVGLVTCGGLCPGLNNVIRSLVLTLHHLYGVRRIIGFRYGYHGMNPGNGHPPIDLTPEIVSDIHETGGTILGTSRGPEKSAVMVDFLQSLGVNILFTIGGDGTQQGSLKLQEEARSRS
jgi:6-phosphofructokinase 1